MQEGQRALNVNASEQSQLGRAILEHAVRQAAASLIRRAEEANADALAYAHGASSSPSVSRLLDLTLHLGAQRQIDTGMLPAMASQPVCACLQLLSEVALAEHCAPQTPWSTGP
jgi:hypothetical protein